MADIQDTQQSRLDLAPQADFHDRREQDRRKEPCDGYCYITTVGWICRREKLRRKEDSFDFFG